MWGSMATGMRVGWQSVDILRNSATGAQLLHRCLILGFFSISFSLSSLLTGPAKSKFDEIISRVCKSKIHVFKPYNFHVYALIVFANHVNNFSSRFYIVSYGEKDVF